jgi:hypothetical protein
MKGTCQKLLETRANAHLNRAGMENIRRMNERSILPQNKQIESVKPSVSGLDTSTKVSSTHTTVVMFDGNPFEILNQPKPGGGFFSQEEVLNAPK